jgi:hypothetical protein
MVLALTSPVLFDSSLITSAGTAATTALEESPFLSVWRPLESEAVAGGIVVVEDPLEVNAATEDVDLVIPLDSGLADDDPLLAGEVDAMVTSGDLGGCWCNCCLALKGLVDLDLFESKFRPTLEALEPRLFWPPLLIESRSSVEPIFSNMARALLKRVWWLSVRDTKEVFLTGKTSEEEDEAL